MERTNGQDNAIRYELTVTPQEARSGATRLLSRNNKRLEVNIPAGVITGSVVKLTNAQQVTDGQAGDILIDIKVAGAENSRQDEYVIEVTDANFTDEVLNSSLPVVVDFWAPWCSPCLMMAPIMGQAAMQYQGRFKFCKINVDENPSSAATYKAMSIPMLLVFKNGQVVDRSVGAQPAARLKAWLDSLG
jgi:thioredoxin 1